MGVANSPVPSPWKTHRLSRSVTTTSGKSSPARAGAHAAAKKIMPANNLQCMQPSLPAPFPGSVNCSKKRGFRLSTSEFRLSLHPDRELARVDAIRLGPQGDLAGGPDRAEDGQAAAPERPPPRGLEARGVGGIPVPHPGQLARTVHREPDGGGGVRHHHSRLVDD